MRCMAALVTWREPLPHKLRARGYKREREARDRLATAQLYKWVVTEPD